MPKEQKKRGRRAEKKRKLEHDEEEKTVSKKSKQQHLKKEEEPEEQGYGGYPDDGENADSRAFYGLLTEEEQEYFRRADEMLELNSFNDAEERELFLQNIWKEVEGKELKLSHSQGCSRLMERLILVASHSQLKRLFQVFNGAFLNMVQHRFASHCCETLFAQAAPVVTKEIDIEYLTAQSNPDEIFATMESLFLYMLNELEPQLRLLFTHRFASHTIRTLLLILSGKPIASAASLVQSRKKENITVSSDIAPTETGLEARAVPQSFQEAVNRISDAANDMFEGEELRFMATHKVGSPVLQILLQLEMGMPRKERTERAKAGRPTLLEKMTGINEEEPVKPKDQDDSDDEEGDARSSGFFRNLLYDPVGSHLAENMMQTAPKREFNKLYNTFFKGRIGNLARNETAAYVVQRVLEKLGKDKLQEAAVEILPQIFGLIERSRVGVIKTLIDCCAKQNVDATEIAKSIASAYDCPPEDLIFKILSISKNDLTLKESAEGEATAKPKRDPSHLHGSLLAQSMLNLPGEFYSLVCDSLLAQPPATLVALSKHPQASHIVQTALTSQQAPQPSKRKLLNLLKGNFADLAQHSSGSYIVDACWDSPTNYRQSIADELLHAEPQMRDSFSGRVVWRNWGMDVYKTKRAQWFKYEGGSGRGVRGEVKEKKGGVFANDGRKKEKTPIELARERKAKEMAAGSGANSIKPRAGKTRNRFW